MKKYDVIVLGGGFAGIGAAIGAAREGAKVLIIEKSNNFGGTAANCLVIPFMRYYTNINGERVDLSRGIFAEIVTELEKRNAIENRRFMEEDLKLILNRMVLKEKIDVLFHANIFDVKREGDKILSVSVATRGGVLEFEGDYFIDATGDAQAAFLAGIPCRVGREEDGLCQPMTLSFRVANVDTDKFNASKEHFQKKYKEYLEAGKFINPRENILIFNTPIKNVVHFNTTRIVKKNPVDPFDLTQAELEAREQVYEVYEFLKEHADGLENSYISMTASEIGVRESRMIEGEYTVTGDDFRNCVKFDDAIAAGNYDIDIHNPEGSGTYIYRFADGQYYTIPYRALIPKGVTNMLVAGRCISSDHTAQAAYRIMPIVCCIGESAGIAAAIAHKNSSDVRDVDIKQLQSTIVSKNGIIEV